MRKALLIGVNRYRYISSLTGCNADAIAMGAALARHANGSPNFQAQVLTTAEDTLSHTTLRERLQALFSGECDTALFYFAGHGNFDQSIEEGVILAEDAQGASDGIRVSDILLWAGKADGIRNKVIILDCCQAGAAGEHRMLRAGTSTLGDGVTILTACRKPQVAREIAGHGVFTRLLLQAVHGGAANVLGAVTPGAVYAFIDNALGSWEQRPVFKTNVSRFISLRDVEPLVPADILRKLPEWFEAAESVFRLAPSYEPTAPQFNPAHGEIFAQLQRCNRHSLVEPVDAEHMYYAAINSTGCRLTALGAYYRELALKGRL